MKINKIKKAVFKANELTIVEDENGTQWVGTHAALYSMDGLPHMHDGQVCRLLDISAEKAAGLNAIKHYEEYGGLGQYNDVDKPAPAVKDMDDEIVINDVALRAVTDENGRTVFFDPDLIAPVTKADIFKLSTDDKLLAFEGLFLVAIISPLKPGAEMIGRVFELYSAMK